MRRTTAVQVLLVAVACFLSIAGTASALPKLRVEGPGTTLEPGAAYVTHSTRVRKADGDCNPLAGHFNVKGSTPMGLLGSAAEARNSLWPVRANSSFGLLVCRIDAFAQTSSPFRGWAYRLNHEFPSLGAAEQPIDSNDSVLWYYIDYGSGANTGDELALSAPVRATPGTIQVSVAAYPFSGGPGPAPDGTQVTGGDAIATTTGGTASVALSQAGVYRLRASSPAPGAVPSALTTVCVNADLARCPSRRGWRMIGTTDGDRISGTRGPDTVRSRAGDDRVNVLGRSPDHVNCGSGHDRVRASGNDTVRRCEVVIHH